MSFSSYTPLAVYPGDGSTTVFPLPDKFYDAEDVRVYLIDGAGVETELDKGSDFSVIVTLEEPSRPGLKSGNVSLIMAPGVGIDVVPFLLPPVDQDQKFEGRPVTPRMQERVHDRHSMRHAGLLELFFRGYRSPLNTAPGLRFIAAGREGYVPTWDADGNLIEGPTVGQVATVADNIVQVNAVAAIAPQVVTVASLEDEIRGLYPVRTEIAQLGPVSAQIATLAPVDGELVALAPVATQIGVLGSGGMPDAVAGVYAIRSQVVIVADADDDIATVAANIAAIIAAAGAIPDLAAKLNEDGSNAQAATWWALQPIGVPIPLLDNISGVSAPPTDQGFRYIKLTASDGYNAGVLTSESVSGSSPNLTAVATVNLAGSPLNGQVVPLINTDRRFLRAGSVGTKEQSQNLSHGHIGTAASGGAHTHSVPHESGTGASTALALTSGVNPASVYTTTSSAGAHTHTLTINADGGAEARPANIGVTYYMRIK